MKNFALNKEFPFDKLTADESVFKYSEKPLLAIAVNGEVFGLLVCLNDYNDAAFDINTSIMFSSIFLENNGIVSDNKNIYRVSIISSQETSAVKEGIRKILEDKNLLLEQQSPLTRLSSFPKGFGPKESNFIIEKDSLITFNCNGKRAYNSSNPLTTEIFNAQTKESIYKFEHNLFGEDVSFVIAAGEYDVTVTGGNDIEHDYTISSRRLPE